jgi:hypothetical protein
VKIVGTGWRDACHAYRAASAKYTISSGVAVWKRAKRSRRGGLVAARAELT